MIKKYYSLGIVGLNLLFLVGCGTSVCSTEFIDGYNEVIESAEYSPQNARSLAQEFQMKYPDKKCKATVRTLNLSQQNNFNNQQGDWWNNQQNNNFNNQQNNIQTEEKKIKMPDAMNEIIQAIDNHLNNNFNQF